MDYKKLSLMDALDLAIFIEREARERYEQFTERMGTRYARDAGEFFAEMAKNEAKHESALMKRREQLFQKTPARVSAEDVWDVEAPEAGKPRSYMSPRQAMELALESEVKAYNFFDTALKSITNTEVKALFEELRGEEMEHQNMLKKAIAHLPPGGTGADREEEDLDDPSAL